MIRQIACLMAMGLCILGMICFTYEFIIYLTSWEEIEHSEIITDKWIMNQWGSNIYRIELNNTKVISVYDDVYFNLNIGDYYNWTEKVNIYEGYFN